MRRLDEDERIAREPADPPKLGPTATGRQATPTEPPSHAYCPAQQRDLVRPGPSRSGRGRSRLSPSVARVYAFPPRYFLTYTTIVDGIIPARCAAAASSPEKEP